MKNMAHVWIVTAIGALGGAALLGAFMATSGADLRSGKMAGDTGIGLWSILTSDGSSNSVAWIVGGVVGAVACFAVGRSSLQSLRWREAQEAKSAAAPHPLD